MGAPRAAGWDPAFGLYPRTTVRSEVDSLTFKLINGTVWRRLGQFERSIYLTVFLLRGYFARLTPVIDSSE